MILPFERSYLLRGFLDLGKLLLIVSFPCFVLLVVAFAADDPDKDAFEFLASVFGLELVVLLTDPD